MTVKMSARILLPIHNQFRKTVERACLRRDDYMAALLDSELNHFEAEVVGSNSDLSRAFIKKSLNFHQDRVQVSFSLPKELVDRLDRVCDDRKIPRDALLNRILFVLVAPPFAIDELYFPLFDDWRLAVWEEGRNESTAYQHLFYPLEQGIDPFWAIRFGLGIKSDLRLKRGAAPSERSGFYTTVFTELCGVSLYGLNCLLDERSIPGTREHEVSMRALNDLFPGFDDLPTDKPIKAIDQARLLKGIVAGTGQVLSEHSGGNK